MSVRIEFFGAAVILLWIFLLHLEFVQTVGMNPSTDFVRPKAYLLLNNIGKKTNFGQLIRSAAAFGVSEVTVVGAKKISELSMFGHQGTRGKTEFRFFDTLEEAKIHFQAENVKICGIEIGRESQKIIDFNKVGGSGNSNPWPFIGDTCFMLGNEASGLSERQLHICDFLTYIPQSGSGTASLNVLVAGSIVFHHFSLFAGMEETKIVGQKFVVSSSQTKLQRFQNPNALEQSEIERKREMRSEMRVRLERGRSETETQE